MKNGFTAWPAAAGLLLVAISFSEAAHADEAQLAYKERGSHRSEGIVDSKNVSGDVVSLVAIHLRGGAGADDLSNAKRLYLKIPRTIGGLRSVEVRESHRNYLMKPEIGRGGSGKRVGACDVAPLRVASWFCWPTADVVRPAMIQPTRLRADAVDSKGEIRLPAVLSASGGEFRPVGYEFHLDSTAVVEGRWWIARDGGGGKLERVSKREEVVPRSGPVTLFWRPSEDSTVDVLHFVLKGRVHTQPPQPLRMDVRFAHAMASRSPG
ncbi:MAG: hypothetical protein ACQGVK_19075 [Myxococcota bacterium]